MVEIELGSFMTLALSAALAIVCGIIAYITAIRETRDEIKSAFNEHIDKMHAEYEEAVKAASPPPPED